MKKILILGGGISGLSAAWFLQKKAHVTLLEKNSRCGGLIKSLHKEGFIFEEGPRGFLSKGKDTLQLIQELGIDSQLIKANKKGKKRYLYWKGQLRPLKGLFLFRMNFFSYLYREWHRAPSLKNDESIGDFFERRFDRKFVNIIVDPLVKGIFAGDPYNLSMQACFPTFCLWEKKYGSLTKAFIKEPKAASFLYSFIDGMETLPQALVKKLETEIHLNTKVQKIILENDKVSIHTPEKIYEADHLIAAIPSKDLALLMPSLFKQPYFPLTTVNCGFFKNILKKKGFGYLISSEENESILGMTWNSQTFLRNHPASSLSILMSGHRNDAVDIAKEALRRHMKILDQPDAIHVSCAEIPQYPVGFVEKKKNLFHPRLTLLGNSYDGPGINDCISKALEISLLF